MKFFFESKILIEEEIMEKWLFDAIDKNAIDVLTHLINTPENDVNKVLHLDSLLHVAVMENKLEIVKILVENCKDNIHAKNKTGNTPVHVAAFKNL
jgi:ankyrin repeat protein